MAARRRDEVFAFFADASNLDRLTPPWLGFRIATPLPIVMAAGTSIDYRISVHGVPMRWRSEISVWQPPERFVDRQVKEPSRRWIHTHTFAEEGEGTRVSDRVEYAVFGGAVINRVLVARDLQRIFTFRVQELRRLFDVTDDEPPVVTIGRVTGAD